MTVESLQRSPGLRFSHLHLLHQSSLLLFGQTAPGRASQGLSMWIAATYCRKKSAEAVKQIEQQILKHITLVTLVRFYCSIFRIFLWGR